MATKITRISEIARERPKEIFTSVYHLINHELLLECFTEIDGNKAVGLDKVTKEEYMGNLGENLNNLVSRLKTMSYRPTPARKVNIPKANGKLRGLAIANFEDKIVQMAVKKIVEAIFEPKFPKSMFGFRPNIGQHDALRYLNESIERQYTSYIIDADIKGFFDNINHENLMKCLEMHIRDTNLLRLIKRFLKAGIIEGTEYHEGEIGTPQGSILSPILANIYMYYCLALWFENAIKKKARGYCSITIFADDFVCCFQYKNEAQVFYEKLLPERLAKGKLELARDKTRLIEFGRFAKENCKTGKPETFDFLGFTHYCSKSKNGKFRVKRKTSKKKFKTKVQEFNIWMKNSRNEKLGDIMATIKRKLSGHYNYYGITDNSEMISNYAYCVRKLTMKWLNRRSQKKSYDSAGFNQMLNYFQLPVPKIKVSIYANHE